MRALGRMWPRVLELLLGAWLVCATLWTGAPAVVLAHDLLVGGLIVGVSGRALRRPSLRTHLWNVVAGLWLVGIGFSLTRGASSVAAQNQVLVGMAVAMLAIIPTRPFELPPAWRRYYAGERRSRAES